MAVDYFAALRELPPGPTTAFRDHMAEMELVNGDREVAAALSWVGGLDRSAGRPGGLTRSSSALSGSERQ